MNDRKQIVVNGSPPVCREQSLSIISWNKYIVLPLWKPSLFRHWNREWSVCKYSMFFLIIWIPLVFFSKRIINLAPTTSVPPTLTVPSINRAQFRVTCGHCNEVFMVGTFSLIIRCFYWFLSSLSNTLFLFAQISSFTQQATLPDALTAEECEYTVAFAVLCMITLFWLEYRFWPVWSMCLFQIVSGKSFC